MHYCEKNEKCTYHFFSVTMPSSWSKKLFMHLATCRVGIYLSCFKKLINLSTLGTITGGHYCTQRSQMLRGNERRLMERSYLLQPKTLTRRYIAQYQFNEKFLNRNRIAIYSHLIWNGLKINAKSIFNFKHPTENPCCSLSKLFIISTHFW